MAVTIDTPAVATRQAVYAPAPLHVHHLNPDRDDVQAETSTGETDNGSGFVRYTVASHSMQVGDVITGSGYITQTTYNVRQTITAQTATTIDTDVAFVGSEGGTLTRTNDNFQLKVEIQDSSSVTFATLIVYIDNNTGKYPAVLDSYLRPQMTWDLETIGGNALVQAESSFKEYKMVITEQFDNVAGLLTDASPTTTSSAFYAFNAALQYDQTQDLVAYQVKSGGTAKFLTARPKTTKLYEGEEVQLHFLRGTAGASYRIEIEKFDLNGASLGKTNYYSLADTNERFVFSVNSNHFASATHSKIIVQVADASTGTGYSEKLTFLISDPCFTDPIRVWWFNRLSGFDQYTFSGRYEETIQVKRRDYRVGLVNGYTIGDRGHRTQMVNANDVKTTWSEFLKESEALWLAEIYSSPLVFIQDGSNFVPIDVMTKKQDVNDSDQLKQFKLEYKEPQLEISVP